MTDHRWSVRKRPELPPGMDDPARSGRHSDTRAFCRFRPPMPGTEVAHLGRVGPGPPTLDAGLMSTVSGGREGRGARDHSALWDGPRTDAGQPRQGRRASSGAQRLPPVKDRRRGRNALRREPLSAGSELVTSVSMQSTAPLAMRVSDMGRSSGRSQSPSNPVAVCRCSCFPLPQGARSHGLVDQSRG